MLLITLGVTVFNFGGKAKGGASDSAYGLGLIGASLVMDAVRKEKNKGGLRGVEQGVCTAREVWRRHDLLGGPFACTARFWPSNTPPARLWPKPKARPLPASLLSGI